jgi:polar amino acid transport system substrate-binding protein/glutamine transport system substrate-binding protein
MKHQKKFGFIKKLLVGMTVASCATGILLGACGTSAKAASVTTKNVKGSLKGVSLNVGTSGVFAPFSYYDTDGKTLIGYDIDLINDLQDVLGFKIKGGDIQVQDYAPLVTSVSEGKLDVVAAALCATSERKKVMSFSNTYLDSGQEVMINKTAKSGIKSVSDLAGKKVAVEKGTASHTYASKNLTDSTIEAYDKITGAYQALEQGKVDALIQDAPNCAYYIKTQKDTNLKIVGKQFNKGQSPYAVGLTKNSKYKANFNAALKILKQNGTLAKLATKWTK